MHGQGTKKSECYCISEFQPQDMFSRLNKVIERHDGISRVHQNNIYLLKKHDRHGMKRIEGLGLQ